MPNPVWPPALPQNQFVGLTDQLAEGAVIRTPNTAGPSFVRPRYTGVPRNQSVPITLTHAQRATFDAFYETTLVMGSQEFDWEDPRTDAAVTFRFLRAPQFALAVGGLGRFWTGNLELEQLGTVE